MAFNWGGLLQGLGAVVPGIAGLFGSGNPNGQGHAQNMDHWNKSMAQAQWDYQVWQQTHRIQQIVKDAHAAGIHPLAALGANLGGVSGVGAVPSAGDGGGGGGASWGDTIGAGLESIGNMYQQSQEDDLNRKQLAEDRQARDAQEAYNRGRDSAADALAKSQLDEQRRVNDAQIRALDASTAEAMSRTALANSRAAGMGTTGPLTPLTLPSGQPWPQHGGSDEQLWENRYGDVVGNVMGMLLGVHDAGVNLGKWVRGKTGAWTGPDTFKGWSKGPHRQP